MKLYHRTNYWGQYVNSSNTDSEVPFDVVWCQAVEDYDGCPNPKDCHGFGRRVVGVEDSDFESEDPDHGHAFKVGQQRGRRQGHYFFKFAALPQGTYGYGKRGCAALGWRWEGEFHASQALDGIENVLDSYLNMDDDDINHVHIGVKMDSLYAPRN